MFDGLKESLGRFQSDVEETAEEKATDSDENESESKSDDGEEEEEASLRDRARSLAKGQVIIDEDDLEEPLWELEMALLESDVEMSVAEEILETIKEDLTGEKRSFRERTGSLVEDALADALLSVIDVGQFDFLDEIASAEKPVVIIFTGVNGVGKTTTIAKVAKLLEQHGYSSVIANGDTYRAGANEQMSEHAENLDVKLISHEQGGDPAAVIYDGVEYAEANDIDVVLGDTAGRLHTSDDLMAQLEKIDRVVDPDMTIFVDEAVAGQDAVNRAQKFNEASEIDGTILTKADADSQGGAAISIAYVTGKPILFLGTGQDYDDLKRFEPEALVNELLET
ncbi:MAG: signal recognition particle-docking protein FtsY [Halobacteriaceae archaeon]